MDAFEAKVKKILKSKHENASDDDIRCWMDSSYYWGPKNYETSAKWVEEISLVLEKKPEEIDTEKFFIKTYGLLIDLPKFLDKRSGFFDLCKKVGVTDVRSYITENAKDVGTKNHLLKLSETVELVDEISSDFSEEELFAITYLRNTYCHPALSDYTVKLKRKNTDLIFDAEKYGMLIKWFPLNGEEILRKSLKKLQAKKTEINSLAKNLTDLKN